MDTLTLIHQRHSLRNYAPRPVEAETRRAVLEATITAPTAGALMLYSIIEIEDTQLKTALSHTCDEQPFIATAPWLLLFAADYQRLYDSWLRQGKTPSRKPGVGDLFLALSDTLIAAHTAVIAAEALGLGSCYIGDIIENAEEQQSLLKLPPYVFPAALLCLGYPPENHQPKQVPRLPLETIVHQDTYEQKDWVQGEWPQKVRDNGLRKYEMDFSAEMTRSVEVWLKNWR